MAEKYLVRHDEEEATLELERDDAGNIRVRRAGQAAWRRVELEPIGDSGLYLLMVDDHPVELYLERRRGGAIVTLGRHSIDCDVGRWRPSVAPRPRAEAGSGLERLTAPMTGSIVEVKCGVGDSVQAGQVLLVIESMKMNNELRARAEGTVESVPIKPGQRVQAGDLLVAIARPGQ
jgi:biotin carboxyl carrier protein